MIQHLSTAAIGAPITRLGVSFFPVYLPANNPPEIGTGTSSGIVVRELENAAVGSLLAVNPTDTPILIVDGEHFLGGKQNRAVNASVLVPARSERSLPVSCLEQGRWGQALPYQRDEVNASPRIRRVIREGVFDSMQQEQAHSSDQGRVWSEIADELRSNQAHSSTAAAMESHRKRYSAATKPGPRRPGNSPGLGRCRGSAVSRSHRVGGLLPWRSSEHGTCWRHTGERSSNPT